MGRPDNPESPPGALASPQPALQSPSSRMVVRSACPSLPSASPTSPSAPSHGPAEVHRDLATSQLPWVNATASRWARPAGPQWPRTEGCLRLCGLISCPPAPPLSLPGAPASSSLRPFRTTTDPHPLCSALLWPLSPPMCHTRGLHSLRLTRGPWPRRLRATPGGARFWNVQDMLLSGWPGSGRGRAQGRVPGEAAWGHGTSVSRMVGVRAEPC